ncbi:Biotin carboxyl carrier protein of acetyl-CoA carboxylase [Chlamydiales bacterium STE3]|nr:Biotin carboxyl carrier protein of acetyl-CoA carboxylase [Chlamydiales bacterium STE3]
MELKQIKELMTAMERTGTKKLMLKNSSYELQLERDSNGGYAHYSNIEDLAEANFAHAKLQRYNAALPRTADMSQAMHPPEEAEKTGTFITSPMVGTFYSSPSPENPPFIKVGDQIEKNHVVCIIEAMKVMNEIKANISGTVVEVLVESGHPVEFGTKLFRIT